jgi:DNA-binding SARP family transcriptional activator/tetratricopeptide (TPR) repeat protein
MVDFRMLGPVAVVAHGQVVEVGPPQRCAVLAVLAVESGRQVSAETLIDRVWGERSPERARRALHAHVARIRRILEQAGVGDPAPAGLLRRSGGYLLDAAAEQVDLHRFRGLVERSRGPDLADAARVALLREALGLWHGEPLAGLAGQWAARTRQGLRQQRLDAVLAWAGAELAVGNPAAAVGPLTDLLAADPVLEPLAAILMRALYATGDGARALQVYTSTRRRLMEELGTEPGPQLRRIQQGILSGDIDPGESPVTPERAPTRRPGPVLGVPAQLPRDVRGFTGRRAELARLDGLLREAGEQATAVVIAALAGTAGVGKTALAVHWAHRVKDRFPDGQLYVNLRGFDPGGQVMTAAEAVRGFLDALGVQPQRIPAGLHERAGLYRSLLADRRMLVVLDNTRDAEQVGPLLPGAPGCLVLITSRSLLSGLLIEGAQPLALDLLTRAEARQLLARRLGPDRIAGEPQPVEEIITRCARLPLALAIVAARAAAYPQFPLDVLAKELLEAERRLEVLAGEDPSADVRAVLSWSYRVLEPKAAGLFRLLGLHCGPDISTAATANLAGMARLDVRPLLAELARAHLIIEHAPGRYTFHDLLRAYATELALAMEPDPRRQAAVRRALDHYLQTANTAAMLIHPHRDPITPEAPLPGVGPEPLADSAQATGWLTAEHPVLLAAINQAGAAGLDTHTWQLAWTLVDFQHRFGHWQEQFAAQSAAVAAAQRLADHVAQARAHNNLAHAHIRLGHVEDANTQLRQALDLYRRAGDRTGQAHIHLVLAEVREQQGRLIDGLDHSRQALRLYRATGYRYGQAWALTNIGWFEALTGDDDRALGHSQQALALHQEHTDTDGQSTTWLSLGRVHQRLGHHAEAVTCYQQAVELTRHRHQEAEILTRLGDTHHAAGNADAARTAWQHAVTILDDLDHPDAERVRAKLRHPGPGPSAAGQPP